MVDISPVQIKPSLHYPISERRYAVDQSRYHADTCDLSNSANERAYDVRYWHKADIVVTSRLTTRIYAASDSAIILRQKSTNTRTFAARCWREG